MKRKIISILLLGSLAFGQSLDGTGQYKRSNPNSVSASRVFTEKLDSVNIDQGNGEHRKELIFYDGTGRFIRRTLSSKIENDWIETEKREFLYDQLGNMTSEIVYEWFSSSSSEYLSRRSDYTYDRSGNLISEVMYQRKGGEWVNVEKEIQSFDRNNNVLLWTEYLWDTDVWKENSQTDYRYNESGKMSSFINYSFENGSWVENHKQDFEYSADTVETMQAYKKQEKEWKLAFKYVKQFKHGKIVSSTSYNNQAALSNRTEYLYDDQGNPLEINQSEFLNGTFVPTSKESYSYDQTTPLSEIASGTWERIFKDITAKSKIMKMTRLFWNAKNQAFELTTGLTFNYSSFKPTGIFSNSPSNFSSLKLLHSGSLLTISGVVPTGSSVALFDLSGRKIVSGELVGSSFAVPSLAKGVYVAEILVGKSSVVQKVVVR